MYQKTVSLILLCLIIFIILISTPYRLIVVKGNSMLPTYKNNQIVLAKKVDNYKKNDVVIFESESDYLIKRIVYCEGESVFFYINKERIFIDNSYSVVDDFIKQNQNVYLYHLDVPENCYFVVGDNLKHSDDSRRFGWINKEEIKYKIID